MSDQIEDQKAKVSLQFEADKEEIEDDTYELDDEKIKEYRKEKPRKTSKKIKKITEEEVGGTKKKRGSKAPKSETIESKREELRKIYYTHPEIIDMVSEIDPKKFPNISKMKEQEIDERLHLARHHTGKLLNQSMSDSGVELIACLTGYMFNDPDLYKAINEDKTLKTLIHNYLIGEYLVYVQNVFKILIIYGSHVFKSIYNNPKRLKILSGKQAQKQKVPPEDGKAEKSIP